MPITPIALGVRPVELPSVETQTVNALNQYKLAAAQREEAQTNALSKAYAASITPEGNLDSNALLRNLAAGQAGAAIPAALKAAQEAKTAELTREKTLTELQSAKAKQFRDAASLIDPNDPQAPANLYKLYVAGYKDPHLGPVLSQFTPIEQVAPSIQTAAQQGKFPEFLQRQILGAEKFAEMNKPTFQKQDLGGSTRVLQIPAGGGAATVVPGSEAAVAPGPRQPTEAEILLGVLPSGERVEAARAKLFGKPQQTVEEKAAEEKAVAQARKEGEAAAAAPEKAQKQALQRSMVEEMTGTVLGTIKEAKNLTGSLTTGYAGMLANLPNTEARQLKNRLETIKANLGFDRLQSMRDMSPTGGALGQVAVQELKYLQSSVASLDQLTNAKDLNAQLDKIERHYNNWLNAVKQSETTPAETPTGRAAPAEGEWKVVR